jgi:hypothetical protein
MLALASEVAFEALPAKLVVGGRTSKMACLATGDLGALIFTVDAVISLSTGRTRTSTKRQAGPESASNCRTIAPATIACVQWSLIVSIVGAITVVIGVLHKSRCGRVVIIDLIGLAVAVRVDRTALIIWKGVRASEARLAARYTVLIADVWVILLEEKFCQSKGYRT